MKQPLDPKPSTPSYVALTAALVACSPVHVTTQTREPSPTQEQRSQPAAGPDSLPLEPAGRLEAVYLHSPPKSADEPLREEVVVALILGKLFPHPIDLAAVQGSSTQELRIAEQVAERIKRLSRVDNTACADAERAKGVDKCAGGGAQ